MLPKVIVGVTSNAACRARQALGPVLLAESESAVFSYGPAGIAGRFWLFEPVGRGDFTVASDRKKLATVMDDLIEARRNRQENRA